MSPAIWAVFFGLAVLPTFGQAQTNSPIQTTLCELVKTPEVFDGKIVEFRAEYVSKFQWNGLRDDSCSASLPIGVYHALDDLKPSDGQYAFTTIADDMTHPERLKWKPIVRTHPVRLIEDQNYSQRRKYAHAKFRWKDGGVCIDCPLYRITATATGRFDYFETQTVAVRANPATKPFGHSGGDPNSPLSRFVLQSVSGVTTTAIEPAVYSEPKRKISLEEANDLVYAYLEAMGCNRKRCELEPYHDPYFPAFFGFQALSLNPTGSGIGAPVSPNLGFFGVDPRTGDVWSGVICQKFTSPSLLKLQRTIRQRIGLTDEDYRKAQRPGPMCEGDDAPTRAK